MLPLNAYADAPHLIEFFEFMLAFYAADRLVARPKRHWKRAFRITFPVSRTAAWAYAKPTIEELIHQSTGDDVEITILERSHSLMHADRRQRRFELDSAQSTSVVLLSDGLDSLAGVFEPFSDPAERVALVSLVTLARKASRIGKVMDYLVGNFGERAVHHTVDLHLAKPPRKQEITQRSRTMLAIAAALTVAQTYGSKRVQVSENGMGILNLPLPSLQMRHESSQVLHPANLPLWATVSELLLGGAKIFYPNRYKTKAQMIREMPEDAREMIAVTSSCDAPQRFDANADCGRCSSCVFRKIALYNAGLRQYDTAYSGRAPKNLDYDPTVIFLHQARNIRATLQVSDTWPALLRAQPTLRRVVIGRDAKERADEIASTIELLRRHTEEMEALQQLAYAV